MKTKIKWDWKKFWEILELILTIGISHIKKHKNNKDNETNINNINK